LAGCIILRPKPLLKRLVGKANEVPIKLNGEMAITLLDTGCMVSTITKTFADKHKLEIEPLNNIHIQGAGGNTLPYLGFTEETLNFCFDAIDNPVDILLLVVPDTEYHSAVPVLLGTNCLSYLIKEMQLAIIAGSVCLVA
jgi:hypothetical protein